MARLNMTLDDESIREIDRYRKGTGKPRARAARELLQESLERRRVAERHRALAADYAAGRADQKALLADLEAAQLELLEDADEA